MILNSLRYRSSGEQTWQSWKFSQGSGHLRGYLCLSAKPPVLARVAAAIDFALTGTPSALVAEVALQASDHSGHTWTVQRRADIARIAKNGVVCAEEHAQRELADAWMDAPSPNSAWSVGAPSLKVGHFVIQPLEGGTRGLRLTPQHQGEPGIGFKQAVQTQMTLLTAACAREWQRPALASAQVLTNLCRRLEPRYASYQELCRQYAALKDAAKEAVPDGAEKAAALTKEVALLDQLAVAAEPLRQPGVTFKSLKDDLAKVTAAAAELSAKLGWSRAKSGDTRDLRLLIELRCRLHAHEQLTTALAAAQTQVEKQIEPLFRRYFEVADGGLAGDQQTCAELSSCLASLSLRLRQHAAAQKADSADHDRQKTWFERFKGRQAEPAQSFEETPLEREVADLETAHMGLSYALGRLNDLNINLTATRGQHANALAAIGQAHEGLVRSYAKVRDAWHSAAKAAGLPVDLDVQSLLKYASWHGTLASLEAEQRLASERLIAFEGALAKVERLIIDWRKATGSQKAVDLGSQMVLLSEAANLLRYRDVKRQRLSQIDRCGIAAEVVAAQAAALKKQRQQLVQTWNEVFQEVSVAPFAINADGLGDLFKKAQLVQALALVHNQSPQQTDEHRLFDQNHQHGELALRICLWAEEQTQTNDRLALAAALAEAASQDLHLILLADPGLAAAVAPAGMGQAVLVASPEPQVARPRSEVLQVASSPKPTPNVIKVPTRPQAATPSDSPALLSDRARRTLAMLTTKKP